MVVEVERARLAYYPIPKVACTSLKLFFFEVNHGRPFPVWKRAEGFRGSIHQLYRSGHVKRGETPRFPALVVLRDPFARAVSTWANKVASGRFRSRMEAEGFDFAASRIRPDPPLGEYLRHLADYVAASALLRAHATMVHRFCPDPLEAAAHVIRLEDGDALATFIAGLGLGLPFPHRNASAPPAEGFTRADFAAAMEVLAPDYAFLRRWYAPPDYPG